MPRKPSPETELRYLRREVREYKRALDSAITARDSYRGQLTQARQEVAEWKRRFDTLLTRDEAHAQGD